MRMRISLLVAFVCFSLAIQAQQVAKVTSKASVTYGPDMSASRSTLEGVLAYANDGYYVVRIEKNNYILEFIDMNMVTKKSFEIPDDLEYKEKKRRIVRFFMAGENIYMITTQTATKENIMYYFIESFNTSTLALNNDMKILSQFSYEKKRDTYGAINVSVADDKKHFMVYTNTPDEKGEDETFNVKMMDASLNIKWEKEFKLPYMASLFSISRMYIDSKANLYFLGTLGKEKRASKRSAGSNYTTHVIAVLNSGQDIEDLELKLDTKFISDCQITVAGNGDIIAAGFYSEIGSQTLKGSFYMSVDSKTRQVKSSNLKEFSFELLTENMTEKQAKKAEKAKDKGKNLELYEYDIRQLIADKDGSVTMVAEQYYVKKVTTTSYSNGRTTTTTTYYYYYNDILVVRINPEGEIQWNCKIPKRQVSTNDGGLYSSYVMTKVDKTLYFIFNDHPDNLTEVTDNKFKYMTIGKEVAVCFTTLNEEGKYEKELLFTSEKRDNKVRPKVCDDAKPGEFFLFSERGKDYQFQRVVIK